MLQRMFVWLGSQLKHRGCSLALFYPKHSHLLTSGLHADEVFLESMTPVAKQKHSSRGNGRRARRQPGLQEHGADYIKDLLLCLGDQSHLSVNYPTTSGDLALKSVSRFQTSQKKILSGSRVSVKMHKQPIFAEGNLESTLQGHCQ